MKIRVTNKDRKIDFELNNSQAASYLYEQLPLTLKVENFSNDEKIFYPDKKLVTTDTPIADAVKGDLCYYAPWGDVVMYYADFGRASSLYSLGRALNNQNQIVKLSGQITVTKLD